MLSSSAFTSFSTKSTVKFFSWEVRTYAKTIAFVATKMATFTANSTLEDAAVDVTRHAANQASQLMFRGRQLNQRIPVRMYLDNHATLESIASTRQVERRLMGKKVAYLKQMLSDGEVSSYHWIQDEALAADALTKDKATKGALEEIMNKNRLECVLKRDDRVVFSNGAFKIEGNCLRRKLKTPRRRKIRKVFVENEEKGVVKKLKQKKKDRKVAN